MVVKHNGWGALVRRVDRIGVQAPDKYQLSPDIKQKLKEFLDFLHGMKETELEKLSKQAIKVMYTTYEALPSATKLFIGKSVLNSLKPEIVNVKDQVSSIIDQIISEMRKIINEGTDDMVDISHIENAVSALTPPSMELQPTSKVSNHQMSGVESPGQSSQSNDSKIITQRIELERIQLERERQANEMEEKKETRRKEAEEKSTKKAEDIANKQAAEKVRRDQEKENRINEKQWRTFWRTHTCLRHTTAG